MYWLVLPLVFTVAAWAVGRVIVRGLRCTPVSEGSAIFVGLAAIIVVLSWCSFVGGIGVRPARFVLIPLVLAALALGWRHLRVPDWREIGLLAVMLLAVYLHYLWPVMRAGSHIVLFSAGDFNQYVGMGTWLRDHGIADPVDFGLGFSPLQANVADHQASHLRIGALLLLGLFASFGRADVTSVFAAFTGFILALQALAVVLLARRLAPGLPAWLTTLAGLLFGVSPTATWAAYAAFIPQTLGLAFVVATVAAVAELVAARPAQPLPWRRTIAWALPAGLPAFAAWSCYPEAVPLGALMSVCYLAAALGPHWRAPVVRRTALQIVLGVTLVWTLISPANFWWGVQGMAAQLHGVAHGAEQTVGVRNLLAMTMGAMGQPLNGTGTLFSQGWFAAVSLACCGLGVLGIGYLLTKRERALPLAILLSGAILFGFVLQHYSQARIGTRPDWRAMYTWNLFKAATYLSPFVMPMAFVGLAALGRRLARSQGLHAACAVMALALIAIAVRQDAWAASKMNFVRIPADLRPLLANIPPGRLLLDIHNNQDEADYYQRYAIYGVLRLRPFVSTRDWQPFHLYVPRDPGSDAMRDAFLAQPFRYLLSDRPRRYPGGRALASAGPYTLLDVAGLDFSTRLQEWNRPAQILLNLGASNKVRAIAATVYNAGPSKVVYDIFGHLQEFDTHGANPFVLQLPAEATGSLALLSFEPPPALPPQIFLRPGELPAVPEVKYDLMPVLVQEQISTDAEGHVMHLDRSGTTVRLTMTQAGTSRALVSVEAERGAYLLHLEVGNVTVRERGESGFGAFFGPENNASGSVELRSGSHYYLPVLATKQERDLFAIGFGGWGRGSGSIEIRKLELVLQHPVR
ncbi:hypothetical protein [Ramlibacter sp.]|uniref:hypothetical protein n=1 Tax=Ramlibacter sp. TaxID=1917967 RepID=UPI0026032774|nr:hypothetical protein [Ramlibacter sp.]MDB5954643.1 hypothetical protein [Ramlibacter sp.]